MLNGSDERLGIVKAKTDGGDWMKKIGDYHTTGSPQRAPRNLNDTEREESDSVLNSIYRLDGVLSRNLMEYRRGLARVLTEERRAALREAVKTGKPVDMLTLERLKAVVLEKSGTLPVEEEIFRFQPAQLSPELLSQLFWSVVPVGEAMDSIIENTVFNTSEENTSPAVVPEKSNSCSTVGSRQPVVDDDELLSSAFSEKKILEQFSRISSRVSSGQLMEPLFGPQRTTSGEEKPDTPEQNSASAIEPVVVENYVVDNVLGTELMDVVKKKTTGEGGTVGLVEMGAQLVKIIEAVEDEKAKKELKKKEKKAKRKAEEKSKEEKLVLLEEQLFQEDMPVKKEEEAEENEKPIEKEEEAEEKPIKKRGSGYLMHTAASKAKQKAKEDEKARKKGEKAERLTKKIEDAETKDKRLTKKIEEVRQKPIKTEEKPKEEKAAFKAPEQPRKQNWSPTRSWSRLSSMSPLARSPPGRSVTGMSPPARSRIWSPSLTWCRPEEVSSDVSSEKKRYKVGDKVEYYTSAGKWVCGTVEKSNEDDTKFHLKKPDGSVLKRGAGSESVRRYEGPITSFK